MLSYNSDTSASSVISYDEQDKQLDNGAITSVTGLNGGDNQEPEIANDFIKWLEEQDLSDLNDSEKELIKNKIKLYKQMQQKNKEYNAYNSYDNWYKIRDDLIDKWNKQNSQKYQGFKALGWQAEAAERMRDFFSSWDYKRLAGNEATKLQNDSIKAHEAHIKKMAELESDLYNRYNSYKTNANKYKSEQNALSKVGVTNPFYMLKNGVLNAPQGLSSLSSSAFGGYNRQKTNNGRGDFLEMLALVMKILGVAQGEAEKIATAIAGT